jgi:hypothetical protein
MLAPQGLPDYRLFTVRMRLALLAPASLFIAPLGCAGTISGASGDAETATSTSAVVVVERAVDATGGAHAEGSARFVRVSAPASLEDALRTIGASLELPSLGTCASLSSLAGRSLRSEARPVVELVDVGAVWLEADGVKTHLSPRQVPDITDVVSGVVYARATEAASLPSATRYVVHVAGGQDFAPLNVSALAPDDPSGVHFSEEDGQGAIIARGPTVELAWGGDASDDVVYVDIRPQGVRCAFGNVGHGAISTLFFDDTGTLVVHRLRREPLRATGIDSGEVRFDFARTVAYLRR